MNSANVKQLIDYHYWAAHRMRTAIEALRPEQFGQELVSSFPSIAATVQHLLETEAAWLKRMAVLPPEAPDRFPLTAPSDVAGVWTQLEAVMRAFVDGLDDASVRQTFDMQTKAGKPFTHPRWEALLHLTNHGSYHRGQLTTMLRQVGAVSIPNMDLITYFRER